MPPGVSSWMDRRSRRTEPWRSSHIWNTWQQTEHLASTTIRQIPMPRVSFSKRKSEWPEIEEKKIIIIISIKPITQAELNDAWKPCEVAPITDLLTSGIQIVSVVLFANYSDDDCMVADMAKQLYHAPHVERGVMTMKPSKSQDVTWVAS